MGLAPRTCLRQSSQLAGAGARETRGGMQGVFRFRVRRYKGRRIASP